MTPAAFTSAPALRPAVARAVAERLLPLCVAEFRLPAQRLASEVTAVSFSEAANGRTLSSPDPL